MQTPSLFPASARCRLVPALLAILVVAGCASTPSVETTVPAPSIVSADPTPAESNDVEHSQQFARWVAEFSTRARAAGIDEATLHIAFDNVRFVPSAIASDRAQPIAREGSARKVGVDQRAGGEQIPENQRLGEPTGPRRDCD